MSRSLWLVIMAGLMAAPAAGREASPAAETTAAPAATPPEPRVIDAADAGSHVGEECVVELVVRAARALADKDVCFLNSRKDRRDEANFTVVVFKDGLERYRTAGIENPALHFLDRRIRVRGVVATYKDQPQIVVEDPAQISVVEDAADPASQR